MPMWDPLTNLDPSSTGQPIAGPIFDSLGNAWVVIDDAVSLVAIQSNGTSGTWQPPHIIGPSIQAAGTIGVAVDQSGGFYVTYGTGVAGGSSFPLMWAKYTVASGWQAAAQIYNSPDSFTETFPAIDSSGRIVVVFNPKFAITSIASDPAQSTWGTVQTVSPATDSPILPSVAANKSGTRLALVYLLDSNVFRRGLRYTFFNSSTGQWNASLTVPNSANVTFSGYSTLNAFPIAVDNLGNITVATSLSVRANSISDATARPTKQWSIGGFRYENGVWSMQQLISPSGSLPDLENLGSTALNANGTVLISVPLFDGFQGTNITVFRFTPGIGWDTEIAASFTNQGTISRSKVAWFEGTDAVVVYSAAGVPLQGALYANGAWGSGPAIPGNFTNVTFPALAGAPTGEALLGVPLGGVYVTYLRP
jgi:hypothetical protein